ncbi:kelch-like protein 6 [Glandiceps talaboti]
MLAFLGYPKASTSQDGDPAGQDDTEGDRHEDTEPETPEILGSLEEFAEGITSFYNNTELSDISLLVGSKIYHAHKFIVTRSSDVLQTMLTSSNWNESQQCEVKLEESDDCAEMFPDFLKFMYSGRIGLTIQNVLPVLFLADKYNVKALRKICSDFMSEKVKKRSVYGALRWLSYARKFELQSLGESCIEVILSQLDNVVNTNEWLEQDVDFIHEILKSSDAVICDEYALYVAVQKWLMVPEREDELDDNIKQLIPLIRFSQIEPQRLYSLEESELVKKSPDLVKPHITEAYRFHALVESMTDHFQGEEHIPRCYSSQRYLHQMKDVLSLASGQDRKNILWKVPVTSSDPYVGSDKRSRPKTWSGLCQVGGRGGMTITLHPSEDHVSKKFKTYILIRATRGTDLGIQRKMGVVRGGSRVQMYHHGEYFTPGFPGGHPHSMMHFHSHMRRPMWFDDEDSPPFGGATPVLSFDPPSRHKQYPYGGIESLHNESKRIPLPGTQPIHFEIRDIDPDTKFLVSIGIVLIG